MNNVIEFKKDCIMKTMVSEITDISITHDYKVLDDIIEGYFDISGEYKMTVSGVQKEEFMFTIPFSIALSSLIDRNTINLELNDFTYEIEKDILHLKMKLNMNYEEVKIEETVINEEEEETMNSVEEILNEELNSTMDMTEFHNELMNNIDIKEEEKISEVEKEETINIKEKEEAESCIKNIISENYKEEEYHKYKVYIMRNEDTIESIAIKYNVTLDDLREYNDIENLNIGDKIVIPFINQEINED